MARSSRKVGGGSLAPTVNSALLICLAVAVAALGRIRLKSEESRLYAEINRLDTQLQELHRSNRKLQIDYETMTSPAGLSTRIRDMHLNLVMPGEDARVVLPEPPGESAAPTALAGTGMGAGVGHGRPATLAASPLPGELFRPKP